MYGLYLDDVREQVRQLPTQCVSSTKKKNYHCFGLEKPGCYKICLSLFTIRNLAPYIYLYMLMTLSILALMIMPLPNLFKSYDKSLSLKILALTHSFWALKLYKII